MLVFAQGFKGGDVGEHNVSGEAVPFRDSPGTGSNCKLLSTNTHSGGWREIGAPAWKGAGLTASTVAQNK